MNRVKVAKVEWWWLENHSRGCFNCGMRTAPCDMGKCSKSKQGEGFWRPEGTALVTEEVEEKQYEAVEV
jgi:hypothetical protein